MCEAVDLLGQNNTTHLQAKQSRVPHWKLFRERNTSGSGDFCRNLFKALDACMLIGTLFYQTSPTIFSTDQANANAILLLPW